VYIQYAQLQQQEDPITILISNSSEAPIYRQIEEQIQAAILSGSLRPGEELPSIRKLAHELMISVITTKRAYDELERGHFIETVPGKGSFVSAPNRELMRERRLKAAETGLVVAISEAEALGLSLEDVKEMLTTLWKEKSNG
jgi:GntR family transcriptional regulator